MSRAEASAPDLRFGKREARTKPGTASVDSFLMIQYTNVAETLPDQPLGNEAKCNTKHITAFPSCFESWVFLGSPSRRGVY